MSHKSTLKIRSAVLIFLLISLFTPLCARADLMNDAINSPLPAQPRSKNIFSNILDDQRVMWTSPAAIRKNDLKWVLPFAAGTGLLIWRDSTIMSKYNPSASTINTGNNISILGSGYTTGAIVLSQYALGALAHKERLRKAGV